MEKFTFLGKKVALSALLCCFSLTGFAQEDIQTFDFDDQETQEYAAFFKQPSAIEGKCNAEVMGIDINREGFSWDDMNTWKNSEGKVWHRYTDGYVETLFGVCANASAPFNGKTSSLSWTNSEGDNKWYPVLPAVKNLKGKFSLTNCKATVVHISDTQLDTVRIQMTNEDTDCYMHVRRNLNCKQLDMSGSTGKTRQLAGYRNAFSDENSLLFTDCRQTEFLDWLFNIEDNHYTFSTLPLHPITGKVLGSGYKLQWEAAGGYPIGYMNADGEYEIAVGEDIDLSSEYDVDGNITTYTWKNIDGEEITPPDASDGWFCFDESNLNQEYRCEMTNEKYPALVLKTVFVKVVSEYTSGINKVENNGIAVGPNPAADYITVKGEEVQSIDIFSLTGACVKSVKDNVQTIEIADLAPGIYTIKVVTTNGEKVAKFIKK
ncbi:T9SS type A sorting domain-containing protein [Barnesiella intestinihominis]|uniref:T9SS type A sorting domain-containing protein n=1 Tax=Barnesiella intestinihominis TaxID=487174 RepID=UPI003A844686